MKIDMTGKRYGSVVAVKHGITDTYAGWSKRTGLNQSTIAMRITRCKWPITKALTKGATP